MSENFLLNFKHSYTIIIPLIIFSALFVFIDSKISGKKVNMTSYLKTAICTACIAFIVVYINTLQGVIQEEIHVNAPPF